MEESRKQLARANCLDEITQRIGFALWQVQELESVSAQYCVLVAQAEKGMGKEAGNAAVKEARKKTFGHTIKKMAEQELLSSELGGRFSNLLSERNWLVHSSRADSRDAIHSDKAMRELLARIDAMANESLLLMKEIASLTMAFVKKHGITEKYIDQKADELLRQWHNEEI